MIISDVSGGLGNQMFQYAMGRALSLRSRQTFRLDTSSFTNHSLHQGYELQRVFQLAAQTATQLEMTNVLGWQSSRIIRRLLVRAELVGFRKKSLVVEPHFHYWSGVEDIESSCYLFGYWQSEKYFKEFASEIRQDFEFMQSISGKNIDVAEEMSQVNGVSLHIRRGDYLSNLEANATHGVCSSDYYRSAIECIAGTVMNPHFFIFSDDMEWVRKNLNMNFPYSYVDHNRGLESFFDMRLMSMCQHHITANSSFSWWGAWLNRSSKKIVISPKRWFVANKNTTDLMPSTWIRL